MVASTVVFGRILLEIGLVAPSFLQAAWLPISLLMVLQASLAGSLWFWGRNQPTGMPAQQNPSELKSALGFALIYAIVVFAVAVAKTALRRPRNLSCGGSLRADGHGCDHIVDGPTGAFCASEPRSGLASNCSRLLGKPGLQVTHGGSGRDSPFAFAHPAV